MPMPMPTPMPMPMALRMGIRVPHVRVHVRHGPAWYGGDAAVSGAFRAVLRDDSRCVRNIAARVLGRARSEEDRLNSSHITMSYGVFCLKKKKTRAVYWCNFLCISILAKSVS